MAPAKSWVGVESAECSIRPDPAEPTRARPTRHARRGFLMWAEFRAFLLKTNALALAIGVIIGAALGAVVTSLVDDIIMPPVGLALGGVDFRTLTIHLKD